MSKVKRPIPLARLDASKAAQLEEQYKKEQRYSHRNDQLRARKFSERDGPKQLAAILSTKWQSLTLRAQLHQAGLLIQ